jgi:hypothetical protein
MRGYEGNADNVLSLILAEGLNPYLGNLHRIGSDPPTPPPQAYICLSKTLPRKGTETW